MIKNFINLIKNPLSGLFLLFTIILALLSIIYLPAVLKVVSFILSVLILALFLLFYFENKKTNSNYKSQIPYDIFSIIMDGIIIYDSNFKIIYFNESCEKIFNLKKEEVLGKQIKVSDAQDERFQRLVQVIFPSLAPIVVHKESKDDIDISEINFTEPDLFLRVLTAKIKNEKEGGFNFVKVIHNRTSEVQALKSQTEFVTIASHQLRTPLNEIRWGLESLISGYNLEDSVKEILNELLNSLKRLMNLIESLLVVSKIEEGKFGYNFEELDYVEFIKGILEEYLPQIRRNGLNLYFNPPKEEIPKIYFDKEKIYMVIVNLLDNAVRYNVPNGNIIVSIRQSEDKESIETTVEDTGIGIAQEELKNLFKKFSKTESGKINTEGSGLGLYITKNIIVSHGGKIWAESELKRGTKITFSLPIKKEKIPQTEVPTLFFGE